MLGVRLEPEIEQRLERLAKKTGRSKSYYAREAIREYVEDYEDYLLAVDVARRNETTISLEELAKKYGMEDSLQQARREAVRQTRTNRSAANIAVLRGPSRRRA